MNERIKELKDKIWAEEYWNNPNTDKLLPAQLNKFAELIVEECSRIADDWVNNEDNGKNYPSDKIKQHFGVKECT
jgi:hypothetical protein